MRKLLLCAVALSSLSACVVSPGYRTAEGQVVPPHVTAYDPIYSSRYAPGDLPPPNGAPYALPISEPVSEQSCRAQRSDCETAIDQCWRGETSCTDARDFCEDVQARCGSFY
jgi:hypothetical protein